MMMYKRYHLQRVQTLIRSSGELNVVIKSWPMGMQVNPSAPCCMREIQGHHCKAFFFLSFSPMAVVLIKSTMIWEKGKMYFLLTPCIKASRWRARAWMPDDILHYHHVFWLFLDMSSMQESEANDTITTFLPWMMIHHHPLLTFS